jgi:hypothetical protein
MRTETQNKAIALNAVTSSITDLQLRSAINVCRLVITNFDLSQESVGEIFRAILNMVKTPFVLKDVRNLIDDLFADGKVGKTLYQQTVTDIMVKVKEFENELDDFKYSMQPLHTVKLFGENVHNVFTSPGPDAPIAELANTTP